MAGSGGNQQEPTVGDGGPEAGPRPRETEMVAAAQAGVMVDAGEGPFEPAEMQSWGRDRAIRASELRQLLVDSNVSVHAKGVMLRGVRISGRLDLESATLRCPLRLWDCYFDDPAPLMLDDAKASLLDLNRCLLAGLTGESLTIGKDLDLSGTTVTGPLSLQSADIGGSLSLVSVTVAGMLSLARANVTGLVDCRGAQLNGVDDDGYAFVGYGLKSGGDVLLGEGFAATGTVQLADAVIGGSLTCSGAWLAPRSADDYALAAYRVKISGDVFLDGWAPEGSEPLPFTAAGGIMLADAVIGGALTCSGAQLTGFDTDGYALAAYRAKVSGSVSLDTWVSGQGRRFPFTAAGTVQLDSAQVGGSLVCTSARLTAADRDGNALSGYQLVVGVDVLLDTVAGKDGAPLPCVADGAVYLVDASIGKNLGCTGGKLGSIAQEGCAIIGDRLKAGEVSLNGWVTDDVVCPFSAHGPIQLGWATIAGNLVLEYAELAAPGDGVALDVHRAQIGSLSWAPTRQVAGTVNLQNVQAALLDDDWGAPGQGRAETGFWPEAAAGALLLDGFDYAAIGPKPVSLEQRLRWIGSQPELPGGVRGRLGAIMRPRQTRRVLADRRDWRASRKEHTFATQPYGHLASVYQQAGHDTEARTVAIARRRDLRRYGHLTWRHRLANWLLDVTITYGYATSRALVGIAVLFVIVFTLFSIGQGQPDLIVPLGSTAGLPSVPAAGTCTSYYPCFSPFGYAIDTVIPVINVHQASNWGPNASAPYGWLYVVVTWAGTGFGWAFATLAVAGYTGLARNSDAL